MKRMLNSVVLHNAVTAIALSTSILIEDYRHGVVDIIMTGFTGTVKVKVSNQFDEPDFSVAASPTNQWTYIDLMGRNDGGATVIGSTGVTGTIETSNNSYAINADAVRWVAVDVEAITAGSVSVIVSAADNE